MATFQTRQLSEKEKNDLTQGQGSFRPMNTKIVNSTQECVDLCAFEEFCNSAVFVQNAGPNSDQTICLSLVDQGQCGASASTQPNITIVEHHVYLECVRCPGQEIASVIEATPSTLEKVSAVPSTSAEANVCGKGEFWPFFFFSFFCKIK